MKEKPVRFGWKAGLNGMQTWPIGLGVDEGKTCQVWLESRIEWYADLAGLVGCG
jgi:hypothetical protein